MFLELESVVILLSLKKFFDDWCDKATSTKSPLNLDIRHCAKLSGGCENDTGRVMRRKCLQGLQSHCAGTVTKRLSEEVTSLNFLILDFFGTSVHQLFSSKMTQQSFCALSPAEAKGAQGEKAEGRGRDKGAQSALAEFKLDSGMYTTTIWPHSPQTT